MKEQHSRPSQCQRIIAYLEQFGSITQREAINDLGIMRLASRISELKKRGYNFESEFIRVKNRYDEESDIKRYWLADCRKGVV